MDTKISKIRNAKLLLLLAAAFVSVMVAAPGYAIVVEIVVNLDGSQEVPPVVTNGSGVAVLTVDTIRRTISGTVDFSGLSTPSTAGHIHVGAAGVNGPVIVPLIGGVGVRAGTMSVPAGSVVLLPAQLDALMADGLYINIHTAAHLGGEIRGQILFSGAM